MKCKNCVAGLFGVCYERDYCQTEQSALVELARRMAGERGHQLGEFVKQEGLSVWRSACSLCGQPVYVDVNPAPDEPDLYGDVLVTDCPQGEPTPAEEQPEPLPASLEEVFKS
ncbi:MAG TPA: hypothetical protein ENN19_14840 [Chloroflexi bacterium]|nr:hypothetical protein [Chloroflexota bacterium]